MPKVKGYVMLFGVLAGCILLWLSIANWLVFALSVVSFAVSIGIYKKHLEQGGMTIGEALKQKK